MSSQKFGITYIGVKALFKPFLALALVPAMVVLFLFLPAILALFGLLAWITYIIFAYRSAKSFWTQFFSDMVVLNETYIAEPDER